MSIAIIAVGYNRPDSMKRLLNSIIKADYSDDVVDLIVSIDKGERQKEVINVAEEIEWGHGEKIIRAFTERQGLRPHILQCGDLTERYDAVVVLEDDITVSKGFYTYVKQVIQRYGEDTDVSGISLYKHRINPGNKRPFDPAESPYDIYFMQMAQSWGECWNRRMWKEFRRWYTDHGDMILLDEKIPEYIVRWNDASWLKYYNRYVVETGTYFVYPYASLTTNHSEIGEHASTEGIEFQVPLMDYVMEYRLPAVLQGIRYDIFFERLGIEKDVLPELHGKKMLDLMGTRTQFGDSDYLVSTQLLNYKVVKEIRLMYRPMEENCLSPTDGKGIFVYDLHHNAKVPQANKDIVTNYDLKGYSWRLILKYGVHSLKSALIRKVFHKP